MKKRTHLIIRAYIAAARNERYAPDGYVKDVDGFPVMSNVEWDESKPIAKAIYDVFGYTATEQFARGIIEQPRWVENLLICSNLKRIFGDVSDVKGFNRLGLQLERYNDVLIPVKENGLLIRLDGYATRQLLKDIQI